MEYVYCVFGLDPEAMRAGDDHQRVLLDGGYAIEEHAWEVAREVFPQYRAYAVGMPIKQYLAIMYGKKAKEGNKG